jgi:hypothetical protein
MLCSERTRSSAVSVLVATAVTGVPVDVTLRASPKVNKRELLDKALVQVVPIEVGFIPLGHRQ